MMVRTIDLGPLVKKLDRVIGLSDDEKREVLALPIAIRSLGADQDIVREGVVPRECTIVLQGFVCRYKTLVNGKRQILSFHLPGDIPDLQSLHLKLMDHSLATLLPSQLGIVRHESVRELIHRHPRIGEMFWRDALIDAAVFREWIVTVGRRPALDRTAHLICELFVRFQTVGLAHNSSFRLSLTQSELSDALGLSLVQVNRSVQQLKRQRLIAIDGGLVTVLDWEGLQRRAEFDATYLHC